MSENLDEPMVGIQRESVQFESNTDLGDVRDDEVRRIFGIAEQPDSTVPIGPQDYSKA
jgi:hypothetical protein